MIISHLKPLLAYTFFSFYLLVSFVSTKRLPYLAVSHMRSIGHICKSATVFPS
jgi:hypothetical protein